MKHFLLLTSLILLSATLIPHMATAQSEAPVIQSEREGSSTSLVLKNRNEGFVPDTQGGMATYNVGNVADTHPMLRLTPDKSELLRLSTEIDAMIIGNPAHLNVILDGPRSVLLVPRDPGATHITLLDKEGRVIMQRHVIVASPKEQYLRIRRTCPSGSDDCERTSVYFCPDMCHTVNIMHADEGMPEPSDTPADGGAGMGSGSYDTDEEEVEDVELP